MRYLLIVIGGGLGALLRAIVVQGIGALVKTSFPPGTLCVNTVGALLIGFLFGLVENHAVSSALRPLLITGFLGGFTTFSSYSLETVRLLADNHISSALLNIALNNVLCLVCTLLGLGISRLV